MLYPKHHPVIHLAAPKAAERAEVRQAEPGAPR